MFKFIVLSMVFYNLIDVNADGLSDRMPPEIVEMGRGLRKHCMEVSGAVESDIENTYNGIFNPVKPLKKYYKCSWDVVGCLDENNSLLPETFLSGCITPPLLAFCRKVLDTCKLQVAASSTEDELLDAIFDHVQCAYKVSPNEYFYP